MKKKIIFKGKLWKYPGPVAWHFISSEKEETEEIKKHSNNKKRGWKSVPVRVIIGKSKWKTSFFGTKDGSYLLPIKASIRKAENIYEDDIVKVECIFL